MVSICSFLKRPVLGVKGRFKFENSKPSGPQNTHCEFETLQSLSRSRGRGLQTVELPSVCVARSKSTRACLVLKVSALNFWLHFGD